MKNILVTGANGQLGMCIRDAVHRFPHLHFHFADRKVVDVTQASSVEAFFKNHTIDYCINTAAYTNVEKAESERDQAFLTNAEGAKHIAQACKKWGAVLLHVSTDYVFDGNKTSPYLEKDTVHPLSVYGSSKLKGEENIQQVFSEYFILRTSWLYSQYGHNFFNSMLRFAKEGKDLSITTEQVGTPTNANDLATALLKIIDSGSTAYGVYHFSNEGSGTWYDFAKAIFEGTGQIETVSLAETKHYRTFAERPAYSVLNKEKICQNFDLELTNWRDSLNQLIEKQKL